MKLYQIVGLILVIVAIGILLSVGAGILPADDLPFAFGTLLIFGVMLFFYARLRTRSE